MVFVASLVAAPVRFVLLCPPPPPPPPMSVQRYIATSVTIAGDAVLAQEPSELSSLRQATRHLVMLPGAPSEFMWYTAVFGIQTLMHVHSL